jgi:hypothetical protein
MRMKTETKLLEASSTDPVSEWCVGHRFRTVASCGDNPAVLTLSGGDDVRIPVFLIGGCACKEMEKGGTGREVMVVGGR